MTPERPPRADTVPLAALIRARRADILEDWERSVRDVLGARDLERPALIDHVPELLDWIADLAEQLGEGRVPALPREVAERHALDRLEDGFDLTQVVAEFALLRDAVVRCWEGAGMPSRQLADLRLLNSVIDRALSESVDRYTEARERALQGLDRIATAALESRSLDGLLTRLLEVLRESTPAVDTAAILLREGDRLRVRAAVGLEEDHRSFSLALGEGFAGRVAAERRPLALTSAATDPLVRSAAIRAKGVRALYGVPLVEAGEVIGVAHIGSLTAARFSEQDRRVFAAMANRATAAIHQHLLRERADRARAEAEAARAVIDALFASAEVGIGLVDTELRYLRVNEALASLNGTTPEAHLGRTVREVLGPGAEVVEPALRRVLETGERVSNAEIAVGAVAGGPRFFLGSYFPVRTRDGRTLGVGATVTEITTQKQVEEALRDRELELRALADNIPQLAWMADATGGIFWYNRRWYDYTGTSPEAMRGWGWQVVHHPEHLDRVLAKWRRALAAGEPWEDTFPLRGADGRYRWFLSRAVPIRDARGEVVRWFGTNTDVTAQHVLSEVTTALSAALDHGEALSALARRLVPTIADWCAIDVVRDDRRIERLAVAHTDLAKAALAEELSRRYPPRWDGASGVGRVIRTGAPEWVREVTPDLLRRIARDPEHLALLESLGLRSYVVVPLVARGRTLGALSVVSADSGRRFDQGDVEFLGELAGRAAMLVDNARLHEEARRAVRARDEILAVVSHDLKTPLGAIELAAQLLLRSVDPDPAIRRQAEAIARGARRMDRLIRDLLDLASLQAGRLAVELRPHDADALVNEALDLHAPAMAEKGVTLARACEVRGHHLLCDRDRVLQVFGNLLGNALKFCRPGDRVTVTGEIVGNEARFSVADSGPGIPPDELARVFDAWWSARRHAKEGTGLGLYITKGIVEAHGGALTVESEPGRGTTFRFTLPVAIVG